MQKGMKVRRSYYKRRKKMERETGFEPATPCLEGRNSTAELLPRTVTHFSPRLWGCQSKIWLDIA